MAPWSNPVGWNNLGWNGAAGGGGAGGVAWTHTDYQYNNAFGGVTTATFPSCNIGTPNANRVVVLFVSKGDVSNEAYSGATINGVTATMIQSSASGVLAMFYASVPSGSTGVPITITGGAANINALNLFVGSLITSTPIPTSHIMDEYAIVTPPATGITLPLTCPSGGVCVYGLWDGANEAQVFTGGPTVDYTEVDSAGNTASLLHNATVGSQNVGLNIVGGGSVLAGIGAAWGP